MNKKRTLTYAFASIIVIPTIVGCANKPTTTANLTEITVASDAKTSYQFKEDFVKPKVNAKYDDQTTKEVSSSCTFTGFDSSVSGTHEINVSYTENKVTKSTKYTVTVGEDPSLVLTSIKVDSDAKKEYKFKEEFVKPKVTATYSNETTKEVSALCTFTGFDSSKSGSQEITVSFTVGAITKTDKYTVTVAEPESTLKFAIFADVQLCNDVSVSGEAATNLGTTANAPIALKNHLQYCKANNINTILMNGDITNQANDYYYSYFNRILKEVYGDDETTYPEFVWNMGNHEWWGGITEKESSDAVTMFKKHARIESKNLIKSSNVKFPLKDTETVPSYYKVINGVPIMVISGVNSNGYIPDDLKAEVQGWLSEIKQLTSVQNGGPIFVEYHYALNTSMTHGQAAGKYSSTLEDIFKDTPNAVVFTGDTHFPGNNERSINQSNFTTINLGSSSYSRMVNQSAVVCDDYYNVEGSGSKTGDKLVGNAKFKEAYTPTIQVVNVKQDNSFTIDRYFTEDGGQAHAVGQQWKFSPIKAKSDFTYTNARFQNKDAAKALYGAEGLSWGNDDKVIYAIDSNSNQMTVQFPDVTDFHYVEHYKIEVNDKAYDVVSNYYKYPENREDNYYVLDNIPVANEYTVKVTAYDFYDNPSLNVLTANEETSTAKVDAIDYQSTLTYCDIQTRNNFKEKSSAESNSSVEYYYKGIQTYGAGAIASRIFLKGGVDCSKYLTLQNDDKCEPTVVINVKNPNNCDVVVGLSIVKNNNGTEEWKDDFSKTQVTVAPGSWTQVAWKLKDYDITSRAEIQQITLKFKSKGATSKGYEMGLLVDDMDILPKAPRAPRRFEAGTAYSEAFTTVPATGKITVDFKFDSAELDKHINVGFINSPDWDNYVGYFEISQNGLASEYEGVSFSTLEDGYVRVVFDFDKITKVEGTKPSEFNMLMIRKEWSNVGGYLEINPEGGAVIRGKKFVPGDGLTVAIPEKPTTATDKVTIDFKITTDIETTTQVMLFNEKSWNDYLGYFKIHKTAALINEHKYVGVTATDLEDGYVRVVFDLNAITEVKGTKPETLTHVFFHKTWGTASGFVDVSPKV